MTCTQCADTGQYDWFDTLNERATQVVCLCSAGTDLLRKQALARVEKFGHVSMGTPIATLATSRVVHDELVRDGLIEPKECEECIWVREHLGAATCLPHSTGRRPELWKLTAKGRAR